MEDGITLHWSRWERIAYIAFFAVWCAFLVVIFWRSTDGSTLFRVVPGLMLAFGVVTFVRMLGVSVRTRGDELVVRNPLRTIRLTRSDIERFSIGRYARQGQARVYVERHSGPDVRMVALEQPLPRPGREREAESKLDRLEAWRTGS